MIFLHKIKMITSGDCQSLHWWCQWDSNFGHVRVLRGRVLWMAISPCGFATLRLMPKLLESQRKGCLIPFYHSWIMPLSVRFDLLGLDEETTYDIKLTHTAALRKRFTSPTLQATMAWGFQCGKESRAPQRHSRTMPPPGKLCLPWAGALWHCDICDIALSSKTG